MLGSFSSSSFYNKINIIHYLLINKTNLVKREWIENETTSFPCHSHIIGTFKDCIIVFYRYW